MRKINLTKFDPVKVLARGWKLEVQNSVLAWLEIKGLNTLGFDSEKNDADTTTFDDAGWQTHLVASRAKSLSLEGFYLEDPSNKSRDPGQYEVESLSDRMGQESLGLFRLTSPAGTVRNFHASANVTGFGGANDDPAGWTAELNVSGAANLATVLVTGIVVSPDTLTLAKGAVSAIGALTYTPANASNKAVTYSSANALIATVTQEGRVVGVATGSTVITVTSVNGPTDTIAVTVS